LVRRTSLLQLLPTNLVVNAVVASGEMRGAELGSRRRQTSTRFLVDGESEAEVSFTLRWWHVEGGNDSFCFYSPTQGACWLQTHSCACVRTGLWTHPTPLLWPPWPHLRTEARCPDRS